MLGVWKAREAYCRAVLAYPNRVGLDGLRPRLSSTIRRARWRLPGSNRCRQEGQGRREAGEGSRRPRRRRGDRPTAAGAGTRARARACACVPCPGRGPCPEPERPRARKLLTYRQPRRGLESAGSRMTRLSRRSSVGRGSSLQQAALSKGGSSPPSLSHGPGRLPYGSKALAVPSREKGRGAPGRAKSGRTSLARPSPTPLMKPGAYFI